MDYSDADWVTVAESLEFSRRVRRLLSGIEHEALITALAANPLAGDLIPGTGDIRKLRWSRGGRGKSGGVRVIYYFHSDEMPLYLLTIYGKGERANLTAAERNELAALVQVLKQRISRES
ncbi:MAG: type II toxin-antitoxin system RelE/ParE family toxin [Betaproteobacteria bacterium]